MLPKKHILLGFIFSALAFLIFERINLLFAGLIFLSSFLIDADHYLYLIFKMKTLNPIKIIRYSKESRKKIMGMPSYMRDKAYYCWCFFHGIEFLALMLVLGIFINFLFLAVFFGAGFHLILDWIDEIHNGTRIDKISSIYDYIKFRKLERFS